MKYRLFAKSPFVDVYKMFIPQMDQIRWCPSLAHSRYMKFQNQFRSNGSEYSQSTYGSVYPTTGKPYAEVRFTITHIVCDKRIQFASIVRGSVPIHNLGTKGVGKQNRRSVKIRGR